MYRLLIVDDEKMIRMGIKNGIDWKSIGVDEAYAAASGHEALEMIEKHNPQIMLTDISMTEMTGLDLIEQVRKKDAKMRILVLTGHDRFDYAQKCLKMQVQDFLIKPIDEVELTNIVRKQIEELETLKNKKNLAEKMKRAEGARQQIELEQFMRDLIYKREAKGIPQELKSDVERSMQIAIVLPEWSMGKKNEENNFIFLTIKNICMGLVDARRKGITFIDDNDRLVIAFFAGEENSVAEQVKEISEILEDESGVRPKIVLGSENAGLNSLAVSYNDAIYLLNQEQKVFGEIIKPKSEQKREEIIRDVYNKFMEEMIANLANSDYVMHVFEYFKQATHSHNFSQVQTQKSCFEMAANIYFSYIMETGEKIDSKLDSLIKSLVGVKREEALEVTEMFIRQILDREEGNKNEIVESARRWINEHLESELSVANLAAKFYVSPNYFSRLFKKVMKEGCNEYIVRKRIDKSCSLLETTTIKTGKIAMMVGYNDTNYFSLAFKKHKGMSPTKYREMMQEKGAV